MTNYRHLDEERAAKQRLADAQAFAAKMDWSLTKARTGASLATNGLIAVEYEYISISSPPRLRDERSPGRPSLMDIRTTRLLHGNRHLAVFASPEPTILAAIAAAEATLKLARENAECTKSSPLVKQIEEAKFKCGQLLDAGNFAELGSVAPQLAEKEKHLANVLANRAAAVAKAEGVLAVALADRDLLDRIAHRYLRVERDAWTHGNSTSQQRVTAHEGSEIVRAVDTNTAIEFDEWSEVECAAAPAPLPIGWLEMLIPVKLPDIKEWASERYEEIDADAPASAGVGASELHRAYLEAHSLHASQCPLESFSAVIGELFNRKRASSGQRYMVQIKLTAAERENRLRAQFEAEKAAAERDEFEAWKASRSKGLPDQSADAE